MKSMRLITALTAFAVANTTALSASSASAVEETVQYALEKLTSGIPAAAVIEGTEVVVVPIRTWKSVSGHYCRRYELTVKQPGTAPDRSEDTRCRDSDGIWKKVKSD